MAEIVSSFLIDQYANESEHSNHIMPHSESDNDDLKALRDTLSDNAVTTNRQSNIEIATCFDSYYSNFSGNKIKESDRVESLIKHFAHNFKRIEAETFYKHLHQYIGVVDSIDFASEKFTAILSSIADETSKMRAEFDFNDLQYLSDIKLLNIGASFIWLIGKETQKAGQQTNISKLVFRRTKALSIRNKEEVEAEANEWTEFFRSIVISNTSE